MLYTSLTPQQIALLLHVQYPHENPELGSVTLAEQLQYFYDIIPNTRTLYIVDSVLCSWNTLIDQLEAVTMTAGLVHPMVHKS